jgi:putative protease
MHGCFREVLFKSAFPQFFSKQRGCKQNCRKKYTVIDQESGFEIELDNEYMMSPKDLCTIGFLDQIVDAGVKV